MKINLFLINGLHRLWSNTVWKHLQETENWIFRYKKRNLIPTYAERTINRTQPAFVRVRVIPFDCLMVNLKV